MEKSWEDPGRIMGGSWEDTGGIMGGSWTCSRAKLVAECLIDDYGVAFEHYQRNSNKGRSFQEIFDGVCQLSGT